MEALFRASDLASKTDPTILLTSDVMVVTDMAPVHVLQPIGCCMIYVYFYFFFEYFRTLFVSGSARAAASLSAYSP